MAADSHSIDPTGGAEGEDFLVLEGLEIGHGTIEDENTLAIRAILDQLAVIGKRLDKIEFALAKAGWLKP